MTTRYFIGIGTAASPAAYNNTANWSETDGGTGGASIPSAADGRVFNSSTVVSSIPAAHSAATVIGQNANVQWNLTANNTIYGSLLISQSATFNITGNYSLNFEESAAAVIQNNAVMNKTQSSIIMKALTALQNKGTINAALYLCSSAVNEPGTVSSIIPSTSGAAADISMGGDLPVKTQSVIFRHHQNYAVSTALRTPLITGDLQLNASANIGMSIFQKFPVSVSGNVSATGQYIQNDAFIWQQDEGVLSYFTGEEEQSIVFPQWISGQRWFVDKTSGTLDLVNFSGYLQGRCKNLIVRAASSVDLSGTPPVLDATKPDGSVFQTAYHGIKSDSTYPFAGGLSDNAKYEREALESVQNYGTIHIPAGKVICTKNLQNYTGAVITGDGMLVVEYGGLTNDGSIAETVQVKMFNTPVIPPVCPPHPVINNNLAFQIAAIIQYHTDRIIIALGGTVDTENATEDEV
ncbi:hypothetical protein FACS18942_10310 [Planctomycetales bacterium]|nr:hypothetical protein FACS18942_10310 [Planctomycetales bacterium]GHT38499.1 hypothetical protein FACS189427_12640 [Planctomycetales bacterium]